MATSHAASRLKVRLGSLTHGELLELASEGCAYDLQLRVRADALIAQRTPLPNWCVDVMQSPDLLLDVLMHVTLGDKAAASVCRVWAEAWTAMLRRKGYLRARLARTLRPYHSNGSKVQPLCGHIMPDGKIVVGDFGRRGRDMHPMRLETLSPDGTVLGPGALKHWRFDFVHAMLEHKGCLFVASRDEVSKFRLSDGEDIGTAEDLSEPEYNGGPCSLAIGGDDLFVGLGSVICVLNPETLETRHTFGDEVLDPEGYGEAVNACAVVGEEIYVGTRATSTLHVFDRTGQCYRAVLGEFGEVQALAFHNGRLFMIEIEHDDDDPVDAPDSDLFGRRLLVLTPDGAITQSIHLPEDVNDIRSMSIRDVYRPRDGYLTEVYLYAMHGAAVYVYELFDLSFSPQPAAAASSGPVSSRLRRRSAVNV